jgi:SAM-dependent methyltransferase
MFSEAKLTGVEYDPRLVSLTKNKVKNARIVQGNAEDFDLNNERFDIIVSLQVIEHLYHPELMLASIRKHLKPEGVFIFTSPNLGCCSARLMKDKWHGYREDHVSLKDFNEWISFLVKNGFAPIYYGSTFFSGIPALNKFPLGILNWSLLLFIGSLKWKHGESFIGIFKLSDTK